MLAASLNEPRYNAPRRADANTLPHIDRWDRGATSRTVQVAPSSAAERRGLNWNGMAVEVLDFAQHEKIELEFASHLHLLILYEQGTRESGETVVDGRPCSTLKNVARKLTFVPAGQAYREIHCPTVPARLMLLYIEPASLQDASIGPDSARLYFDDATLLDTSLKLKRAVEDAESGASQYPEALAVVLVHELIRYTARADVPQHRGGLAPWQKRAVTAHIDAHLNETVPLTTLAELAKLSLFHFCRAFKQSFGVSPHRYHTSRRIEYAKSLLVQNDLSVTEIGYVVGYGETSSFTTAFRKMTGFTPTAYQRDHM